MVVLIFFCTALGFVLYDFMVAKRQDKVMKTAERTTKIVSSIYPKTVQDRIMEEAEVPDTDNSKTSGWPFGRKISQMQDFLASGVDRDIEATNSQPIADLFPETTIMFSDIVGFTAWSSSREPTQVFLLLEAIFNKFDSLARKLGVFKVETIGDCYLAVCGLPEPNKHHAVVMAKFASACLTAFEKLVLELSKTLGPDTADLGMRFGLHSGATTAGVLRGERSRFQLFGDTVNTASRMESTGKKNCIQISAETAKLLDIAGRSTWLKPREDKIVAKGKGDMDTFWLLVTVAGSQSTKTSDEITMPVSDLSTLPSPGGIKGDDGTIDKQSRRS